MKRILLLLVLTLSWQPWSQAAKIQTIEIESQAMSKVIKADVVLPENYHATGKAYPVIYLLHGYSGNYGMWVGGFPELPKLVDLYDIIVVSPDGGYSSWYLDSPVDKRYQYETFVSKEVIHRIDSGYNTVKARKGRAISGLSMGGHGALYLAFRHQDLFGAAASMSGGVDFRPFPGNWDLSKRLGDREANPQNWDANCVINLVDRVQPNSLAILFDCGTSDFFYEVNRNLHAKLLARKIPHDYIEREGSHDLKYWRSSLPYHLLFFHRYFEN